MRERAAVGPAPAPEDEATTRLGMVVFLASWAMMFGALFFAYGVLRLRLPTWPPPGAPELPLALPAANTAVLVASSLCLEQAVRRARAGLGRPARRWLEGAVGLGLLFVALQLGLWRGLLQAGLAWGRGTMAGTVYGLTAFHALHVLVGLVGLGVLVGAARPRPSAYRAWASYWHFVCVVWVVMFAVLFVV